MKHRPVEIPKAVEISESDCSVSELLNLQYAKSPNRQITITRLANYQIAQFLNSDARSFNYPITKSPDYSILMYHYDPNTALEELNEDASLPNPVHLRDMLLRARLTPDRSLELNRQFVEYQKHFGEAQKLGKAILGELRRQ